VVVVEEEEEEEEGEEGEEGEGEEGEGDLAFINCIPNIVDSIVREIHNLSWLSSVSVPKLFYLMKRGKNLLFPEGRSIPPVEREGEGKVMLWEPNQINSNQIKSKFLRLVSVDGCCWLGRE
jgi:hypothetical protein